MSAATFEPSTPRRTTSKAPTPCTHGCWWDVARTLAGAGLIRPTTCLPAMTTWCWPSAAITPTSPRSMASSTPPEASGSKPPSASLRWGRGMLTPCRRPGWHSRRAARADQNATQVLPARIMGVQHIVDVAVQLRWRALIARLELGAEIGPFFASKRHQAAAEGLLRALIALQAGNKIVFRRGVRETCRIQRRLGDPGTDMGPCHEGGIAEQRHAPEHGLRRFEIEDRLEERLRRAGEDFGDLRRDEGPRRCLDRGGDLGTDQ